MQLQLHPCPRPVAQAQANRTQSGFRSSSHACLIVKNAAQPAPRSVVALLSRPRQHSLDHRSLVVRAAKDGLDAELEATQKTLDKVLQAVQAAQAAQATSQQLQTAMPAVKVQEAALSNREQQLWDRQQALMDRMQQQWDEERRAFLAREQQLVSELAQLRQELNQLLLSKAAAAVPAAVVPAAAVVPGVISSSPVSSVGSSPAAAPAAAAAAFSAASQPGSSAFPGKATISGPSSASASVAAAIRAVRDEGRERTPNASLDGGVSDGGSWQRLFESSGERAVSSVAGALAAVNEVDVLSNLDLSYTSTSRGRRRIGGSNGGSGGRSSSSTSSMDDSVESSSMNGSSSSAVAGDESSAPGVESSSARDESSSGSSSSAAVEVQKGDPEGPPPVLAAGDDDIYWVSKLHDGLMSAGFYPADEEVESWFFAESTQTALLTFQACNDLPETGTTCEATWRKLMGEEVYEAAYGHLSRHGSNGSNGSIGGSSNGGSSNGSSVSVSSQVVETAESADGEVVTYSFSSSSSDAPAAAERSSSGAAMAGSSGRIGGSGWPVVMDMDGGREVHALQVCLQKVGFFPGDDEMRWWQFGSGTLDALKTFQACNGLPESGVCDERTWLALLGADATPEDLDEVRGDESMYEDDMSAPHEGAVWLMGEQRWSKPTK